MSMLLPLPFRFKTLNSASYLSFSYFFLCFNMLRLKCAWYVSAANKSWWSCKKCKSMAAHYYDVSIVDMQPQDTHFFPCIHETFKVLWKTWCCSRRRTRFGKYLTTFAAEGRHQRWWHVLWSCHASSGSSQFFWRATTRSSSSMRLMSTEAWFIGKYSLHSMAFLYFIVFIPQRKWAIKIRTFLCGWKHLNQATLSAAAEASAGWVVDRQWLLFWAAI